MKAETVSTIITILLGILAVVVSFLSYYFYIRAKINAATEDAVNNAEQDDKTATEKMTLAVDQIYSIVPIAFKPFITKKTIQAIVQKAFDSIEAYAEKQKKKQDAKAKTDKKE